MVSKLPYAGVDVGASRTKVAILDSNKNLIGHAVKNPVPTLQPPLTPVLPNP